MAWEVGKPLTIETIDVQPPKAREVRVKVSLYKTVARAIRRENRIYLLESDYARQNHGMAQCMSQLVYGLNVHD